MDQPPDVPPPPRATRIEVVYPRARGAIGLRGSLPPLSWEHTQPPDAVDGDLHVFRVPIPPGQVLELKVVRNEEEWAGGRNYEVHGGDDLRLEPAFDARAGRLEPRASLEANGLRLDYEVFLPPSYAEQEGKRYPVLYCLDGQSLWSGSQDPFGVWRLDAALDQLYDLGAVEELIVVGVHTAEGRLERLSPVPDGKHGGGQGPAFLTALADGLRPAIDAAYRTRPGREHTGILGSSMGGLFAFFAAWTRPDAFGRAACLSSSFWWANRWAVRLAQAGPAPEPRPRLYLDSGAPFDPKEGDVNARDGFNHTRSMYRALTAAGYAAGPELQRLVFTGATHDAASWAQRVALPLQLLFPPESNQAAPARAG